MIDIVHQPCHRSNRAAFASKRGVGPNSLGVKQIEKHKERNRHAMLDVMRTTLGRSAAGIVACTPPES